MSSVLKARRVTMDNDHIFSIKTDFMVPVELPEPEPAEEKADTGARAEEKAQRLLKKAGGEAEQILQKARDEAKTMAVAAQRQAEEEADRIRTLAQAQGHSEGYAQGEAESRRIIAEAEQVLADAKQERLDMLAALEPELVNLIIDIVQKLLSDTVALHPETIAILIRRGLADASLSGDISIHVSPDDFDNAIEHKDGLLAVTDSAVKVEFVRDPSLGPMDCVIETPFGTVDCSLSGQFELLRDQLLHIVRSARP